MAANGSAITIDDNGDVRYLSASAQLPSQSRLATSRIDKFTQHLQQLSKKQVFRLNSIQMSVADTNRKAAFNAYPALTQSSSAPKVPASLTPQQRGLRLQSQPSASTHDQWEVEQLKRNNGNPVLSSN